MDEIPIKESPIFLQENDLNNEEKLPSQLKSNQNLCLEMQKLQQARDNFKLKKGESKYEKVPGFFQRKRINFIKKKSGLGGGFYIPFQKKKEKEFDSILKNEEAKKIREFIVKTKKNQRKEEKFVLLNEEQENLKYTKVFNIELPLEIISENKEQFKLKIEAEIPLLEEEILRNDFKDVSIEGNDKKNVNLEQQNNLINSEDRLDSITTIFKEKELGLPEIKSKKFIINQENISEIPLINHTKEVDQLIRGNFQNDEINKKEENLDNDSYFKEESEKQGDEALAHSDAFRNMMPPVIKKICSFKKLIDEPKNNIFNLSIKESIDNFSKEISPQGKIFSSMFSNLNYVASITSITLKDNKQKSKEATIEADKEISESLKMENDKENENTKNNNEEICLNMESDENLYINSQNEDDHKGQKLNKVEISQINEIEGEKTDLDVLIHNESNKANNYIQNQKNTNIIENELEFSTESQDIKKQEINDLLLKNTKIQDMNIQEKSLLEERIQRNENIFKNKIQNTICDLKDEIQKKFSSKLTNDIDEMKKEKNQELQESITKNSINDDKKYHDDTKIESSKEKKKNFEVKNNETQKKTKKSFIHGINKKFIPLKKNNDNSFNNSESLSNANEIEKVENNNVLISNGTILETEEIFDEKFSNSISIKQSPNIVNFETYGIKLDSLIENSSKETNQIKENPEKINFIESILNNSPIITKIAADKRKPGNSWRKCLYFLEKKDIDDAYSELLYCGIKLRTLYIH